MYVLALMITTICSFKHEPFFLVGAEGGGGGGGLSTRTLYYTVQLHCTCLDSKSYGVWFPFCRWSWLVSAADRTVSDGGRWSSPSLHTLHLPPCKDIHVLVHVYFGLTKCQYCTCMYKYTCCVHVHLCILAAMHYLYLAIVCIHGCAYLCVLPSLFLPILFT